jgi:hypothetical protein
MAALTKTPTHLVKELKEITQNKPFGTFGVKLLQSEKGVTVTWPDANSNTQTQTVETGFAISDFSKLTKGIKGCNVKAFQYTSDTVLIAWGTAVNRLANKKAYSYLIG